MEQNLAVAILVGEERVESIRDTGLEKRERKFCLLEPC